MFIDYPLLLQWLGEKKIGQKTTPKLGPTARPAEKPDGWREVISKPGKDGKRPGLRPGVKERGEVENGEGRREAFRVGHGRRKSEAGGERPAKHCSAREFVFYVFFQISKKT